MATQRFNGGSYRNVEEVGLSGINARMINCYVDDVNQIVVRPGFALFKETRVSSSNRGVYYWRHKDILVTCVSNKLFVMKTDDENLTEVTGNILISGIKPLTFATDGNKLWMAYGDKLLTMNDTFQLSLVTDANAPNKATHVVYLDGYIIANELNTNVFHFTAPGNTDLWEPQDFAVAESNADNIEALETYAGELYVFGKQSVEVWANDGVSPFSPVNQAFLTNGLASPYALSKTNNSLYWLDNERQIVQLTGRQLTVISTPYQTILNNLETVDDCISFPLIHKNNMFIIFTFPLSDLTLSFNTFNNTWTEYGAWDDKEKKYKAFSYIQSSSVGLMNLSITRKDFASNAVNDNSIGSIAWNNVSFATGSSDSRAAHASFTSQNQISNYLKLTDFNLSVPPNAIIRGVTVFVNLSNLNMRNLIGNYIYGDYDPHTATGGSIADYSIRLVVDGNIVGDNKAKSGNIHQTSNHIIYGGKKDLWGLSLTPSKVNDSQFGVALSYMCTSHTGVDPSIPIDSVTIYITYTTTEMEGMKYGTIVGHNYNGMLYILTEDEFTDDGAVIRPYIRTGQFTYGTLKLKRANSVNISVKPVDGVLKMRWIDDSIKRSNVNYMNMSNSICRLSGLGMYRSRQYEFWTDDPVKFVLADFEEETEGMRF